MNVSREVFIDRVSGLFDTYQPNQQVVSQLGHIELTTVCAPTCMGKDTLINNTGLPRIIGDTIREPRVNNGTLEQEGREYHFRGEELDTILEELEKGEYVQMGMGPGRNSFYGSRAHAYPPAGAALIDLMTTQIPIIKTVPFSSVGSTYITVPSHEIWLRRMQARGSFTKEEWQGRRVEAIQSLSTGLENEDMVFILNDDLTTATEALRCFALTREYNKTHATAARNAATSILKYLSN